MRKSLLSVVPFLIVALFAFNCSSAPKAPDVDMILKEINQQLQGLEIEGFGPDKTTLDNKIYAEWSKKSLPVLKAVIAKVPEGYGIRVTGHADPDAGEAKAAKVALGRAEHIKGRLAKDLGADAEKLGVKSYGAAEYAEEAGKSISENRRVEFEAYKK